MQTSHTYDIIKFVWIDNILQYLVLEGAKMEWEMGSKITVTPHDLLTAKKTSREIISRILFLSRFDRSRPTTLQMEKFLPTFIYGAKREGSINNLQ